MHTCFMSHLPVLVLVFVLLQLVLTTTLDRGTHNQELSRWPSWLAARSPAVSQIACDPAGRRSWRSTHDVQRSTRRRGRPTIPPTCCAAARHIHTACTASQLLPLGIGRFTGNQAGSVAEWLACWTQAQNGPGSNRSRVLGKLFTPIVPLFTKQQNW